nr:DUF2079 domain-containing protein [Thermoplasma acidophilum]
MYPLYALAPSPMTLLILQSIVISFSSLPLFLIAQRLLVGKTNKNVASPIALAISISYLLSPYTESPISFDFHIMMFLNLFVFSSYYFFLRKNWVLNAVFLAFIVSLHSGYVFISLFIAISQYLMLHPISLKSLKLESLKNLIRQRNTALLASFFAISFLYIMSVPLMKAFIDHASGSASVGSLTPVGMASSSITGLLSIMLSDPGKFITYFLYNFPQKLSFFMYAFASTGFLAFLSPTTLLGSIPYFFFAYLSRYPAYYQLGYQYTVMLIPFVYVSTAYGVSKILGLISKFNKIDDHLAKEAVKKMAILILAILIVGTALEIPMTPIAPHSIFVKQGAMVDLPSLKVGNASEAAFALHKTIGDSNPYLLTTNNLFPVFSNDPNAYTTPYSNGTLTSMIYSFRFEYIVNDPSSY